MRRARMFLVVVTAVAAISETARAADQPRELIDKAINAAGGEEKLAEYNASTWKDAGTYYGMGQGLPYTGNYAVQWPDKFRMEVEGVFTIVLNGDKGWMKSPAGTVPLEDDALKQQKKQHYTGWVTTLLPLKDPAFQLSATGDFEVGGKPALGVKVQGEGKPDVDLFFDKESGLLVKSQNRVVSPELGGKEVDEETFFEDYQDVDGLRNPMKIVVKRDGKDFIESNVSEMKGFEKLEDSVFSEP